MDRITRRSRLDRGWIVCAFAIFSFFHFRSFTLTSFTDPRSSSHLFSFGFLHHVLTRGLHLDYGLHYALRFAAGSRFTHALPLSSSHSVTRICTTACALGLPRICTRTLYAFALACAPGSFGLPHCLARFAFSRISCITRIGSFYAHRTRSLSVCVPGFGLRFHISWITPHWITRFRHLSLRTSRLDRTRVHGWIWLLHVSPVTHLRTRSHGSSYLTWIRTRLHTHTVCLFCGCSVRGSRFTRFVLVL